MNHFREIITRLYQSFLRRRRKHLEIREQIIGVMIVVVYKVNIWSILFMTKLDRRIVSIESQINRVVYLSVKILGEEKEGKA